MEKITQHRRDPGIYHGREVTVLLSNGPGQVIVGKVCILPARLGFVTFMPGFLIQVGDGKGTRKTSDGSFAEGHPDFCIERMIVTVPAKDLHVFCAAKSVNGILHQMRRDSPEKEFIPAPPDADCACNDCPFMKKNSLEAVHRALDTLEPEITLPEDLRVKALRPIERMLELSV